MAKNRNLCTLSGARREVMVLAWQKIRAKEAKGENTFDALPSAMREAHAEVRAEAEKACAVPERKSAKS